MKVLGVKAVRNYIKASRKNSVVQSSKPKIPCAEDALCYYSKVPVTTLFQLPDDYKNKLVYHIDKLYSFTKGSGSSAVKNVVKKSLGDADTQGRVTLLAAASDFSRPHPFGFYYKLGFRSPNQKVNEFGEKWLKSGSSDNTFDNGVKVFMYLPKENIEQCLNYKGKKTKM